MNQSRFHTRLRRLVLGCRTNGEIFSYRKTTSSGAHRTWRASLSQTKLCLSILVWVTKTSIMILLITYCNVRLNVCVSM